MKSNLIKRIAHLTFLLGMSGMVQAASLPLVAETDFSAKGEDDAYYISADMVDGYGKSVVSADLSTGMKLVDSTASNEKKSTFLDNVCYAITPNPIRLDSLRMSDNSDSGEWGFVVSGGSKGINNTLALSYVVGGLKNNGQYKVVVEYCNPHASTYLDASGSNKNPHLTSSWSGQIKVGTNASQTQPDGVQTTAIASKEGVCGTAEISSPTQSSGTQGPIKGGKLQIDIVISQLQAGQAIMIKSIKVYAEVEPTISGLEDVCAGGETSVLSLDNTYLNSSIQWYKGSTAISGATGTTYMHTSGQTESTTDYHYVVTTPNGDKLESKSFTVTDKLCCVDGDGNPMSRKMIWQDDFGTFTSATDYWTWDYSDLSNPVKKKHTDAKGWVACSEVPITGASCAAAPSSEGAYSVAGNVTCSWDNSTTDGTQWSWEAQFGNGGKPKENGWIFVPDHTYAGSAYGGMLFLNCNNEPDEAIYTRTITGLCQKDLTVRCFINTFSDGVNPVNIYIKITDKKSGTVYKSEPIKKSANGSVDWVPVEVSCALEGSEMEFSIVSYAGGSDQNTKGNDLVLDDIQIFACSNPTVDMYFDLSEFSKEEETCKGKEANIVSSDTLGLYVYETEMIKTNLQGKAYYVYQYSLDPEDAKAWKTIQGPIKDIKIVDLSSIVKEENLKDKDKVYFRCVMGLKETLEDELNTYGYYRPNAPCGEFSVSDPIELTINCPVCYTPDKVSIVDTYDGVKQSTVKKTLCPGDQMTLNAEVSGTDGDGNAYNGYYLYWKENHTSSLSNGSKLQYFNSPKDMVISNDGSYTEKTVVTYTVIAVDTFQFTNLENATCKDSQDIEITFLPLPVVEDKSYEFCQGQPATTDVLPTSSDGTLTYYSDADASTETTIPAFKEMAADSYTYYYTLTTASGCVSKPASIDVKVNALPTYTLDPESFDDKLEFCAGQTEDVLPETATDEVTSEDLTIDWAGKDVTLANLKGSKDHHIYEYVATNAAGCKNDPQTIEINAKLAVQIKLLETHVDCGLTTLNVEVDPADADKSWTLTEGEGASAETTTLSPDFVSTWKNTYEKGTLTLSVDKTDYCPSEKSIEIETRTIPVVLTTSPVSYVKKTQAEKNVDIYTASGNLTPTASEGNEAADLHLQVTTKAYPNASDSASLKDADYMAIDTYPVPQATDVNDPNPEVQYYFVRVYNKATDCYSRPSVIRVDFFGAPVPKVHDTIVCLNTVAGTLKDYVKVDQSADATAVYTLRYYSDDSRTSAAELNETDPISTAEAGVQMFYATQSSAEGGESDPVKFTITTIGVGKPTVEKSNQVLDYCKDADALPLVASTSFAQSDLDNFSTYGLEWTSDNTAFSTAVITPSTAEVGTLYYGVRQTGTIKTSGEVCVGDTTQFTVNVSETTVPEGGLKVSYLYSELETEGSFSALGVKDPSILTVDPGYTYFYAESTEAGVATSSWSEWGSDGPVPSSVSKESLNGGSIKKYYVVKRVANDGAKCESDPVIITVTISDSPVPDTKRGYFCEGEDIPTLDNFVSVAPAQGKTADDYQLLWYGTTEPSTDDLASGVTTVSAAPSSSVTDKYSPTVYTYYVAEQDINTNAIGSAASIIITVYPKPVMTIKDPATVCNTPVDLASAVTLANSQQGAQYVSTYFAEDGTTALASSSVTKSGTYNVQMSFPTMGATIAGSVCASEVMPINVTIDTLKLLNIENNQTCPNTPVTLTANIETNVEASAASPYKYAWSIHTTADASKTTGSWNDESTALTSSYDSPALSGSANDTYNFDVTVTAGTCTATQKNIVVTLGDGPIVGDLVLTEDYNTTSGKSYSNSRDNTADPFYTCGNGVTAMANFTKDADSEYKWYSVNGTAETELSSSTITAPGVYKVTFSNQCATSVTFKVMDASISNNALVLTSGTETAAEGEVLTICENNPISVALSYTAANDASKVIWTAPSTVNGKSATIASATPAASGNYKYVITNYGCADSGSVDALVKPYIKFTTEKEEYVARRDSALQINTTISVPATGTPTTIAWNDNTGALVNSTPNYTYSVDKDNEFTITMTDDNYCDASATVKVLMDARLQLETSIDEKMCRGDKGVYLTIDTTGTGKFVYPTKAVITVTETIGEASHFVSGWRLDDGKLLLEVSPTDTATYTVNFTYREDEGVDQQVVTSTETIDVLQPIQIKVPTGLSVCAEEDLEIALVSVKPEGAVNVNWDADATITSGTDDTETITVAPDFDETTARNHKSTKVYTFTATMEGCATKTDKVTITVDEPITGTLQDTTICEGFSVRLDASNFQASTYEWTTPTVGNAVSTSQTAFVAPEATSTYTVAMTRGKCTADAELTVNVNSKPTILSVDSVSYRSVDILLDESYGTSPFMYAVDSKPFTLSSQVDSLSYNKHVAYVKDAVGCMDTLNFTIVAPQVKIPIWFSPNGDGDFENWSATGLAETYPEAEVTIFDRWGKKLVTFLGSDAGWDGTYNGNPMPSTDYWYEIHIREIDKTYTGHFTLMRR